jgi:hypothetical protein
MLGVLLLTVFVFACVFACVQLKNFTCFNNLMTKVTNKAGKKSYLHRTLLTSLLFEDWQRKVTKHWGVSCFFCSRALLWGDLG